jgi:hypothetical protein
MASVHAGDSSLNLPLFIALFPETPRAHGAFCIGLGYLTGADSPIFD